MSHTFVLQRSILPDPNICDVSKLFYRSNCYFNLKTKQLIASDREHIDFHTLFNLIPVAHYHNYLGVETVTLTAKYQGRAEISLFANLVGYAEPKLIAHKIVESADLENNNIIFGDLEIGKISGYLYLVIDTDKSGFIFKEFSVLCMADRSPAKVGIVSCTFKREKEVLRTIDCIREEIAKDPFTFQNTQVYIIDNDEKRNLKFEETDQIHHIANKNLGGAGGFTRGIIETIDQNLDYVLLCDDDILAFGEIFRRAIVAISLLKDPKMGLHGAMLELENQHMLHEAGEYFDINKRHHINPHYGQNMLDFGSIKHILFDTVASSLSANMYGWWFTAFPVKVFKKVGLPLPIFVSGDDLEFSLRAYKQGYSCLICPTIAIWHPSHMPQHSPMRNYFIMRNRLAYFPLHTTEKKTRKLLNDIIDKTRHLLLTKRYATAESNILALEDFVRAGAWYNEDLSDWLPRFHYLNQDKTQPLYKNKWTIPVISSHPTKAQNKLKNRALSLLTFNGHILPDAFHKPADSPASQYHICVPYGVNPYNEDIRKMTFRASSVLFFDPKYSVGYRVEHSSKKFWLLSARLAKVSIEANLKFKELYEVYNQLDKKVTTFEWWRDRLGV
ncbi:glycosyltransferase family 2 protein [Faucicola atlantae]|uniref:glycosyltransferase family 2 protein n=1 Tax=Faucicola atlantae TaxID=34059 RepID=UPI0009F582B4|nr:glycosyltransferase [Moraxella atlantae]